MKRKLDPSENSGKRGVALIVVLGFLSIMILLAVAFLTQARMERLVAGVSLDGQRARQMARTAVNAAMSDYSYTLYGSQKLMLPPKGTVFDLFVSKPPYASGEVQPSLAGNNGSISASGQQLMQGEARNWIPREYLEFEDDAMDDTRWMLVRRDPSKGPGADNPIVGRYAYLCFDMSGGMDANLIALSEGVASVGKATNRNSVRDIGLGELLEMQPVDGLDTPPDASLFKRLRRGWHGFDTLSELILLTNGRYNGGENQQAVIYNGTVYYYIDEGVSADELPTSEVWGPPGLNNSRWRSGEGWTRIENGKVALNSTNVSDLVPYSLATFRGWEYDPNTAKWNTDDLVDWQAYPSWDEADWASALGDLKEQFADEEIPVWWQDAVADYTGAAAYPKGTNYPSPKNVPMINEVSIRVNPAVLAGTTNQLHFDIELQVEVWFPFPDPENAPAGSFTLEPTIGGGPTMNGTTDIWIPMQGQGAQYTVPAWSATPASPATFTASYNGGTPEILTLTYSVNAPVTMADTNATLIASMPLQILTTAGNGVRIENSGGQIVDWIPSSVIDLFGENGPFLALNSPTPATYYWEVHDPRLNHEKESAWGPADGSMGAVNDAATANGYGENGDSTTFYCANKPMTAPVELGYLSTGLPWKTLEFCTKEGADALSRMVSTEVLGEVGSVGVAYTNGTVNPNTGSSNVLRAVFSGLQFKDDGSALDDAELDDLVKVFLQTTATKKIQDLTGEEYFGGACMRGIDWIWAKPFQANEYFSLKGWTKNERHRLIERTWGLFNPNNSMFTVLAIGQVVKEGPEKPGVWSEDDLISGERRAVAMVWRDPTPPGLGKPHEMFVRVFKFMDE